MDPGTRLKVLCGFFEPQTDGAVRCAKGRYAGEPTEKICLHSCSFGPRLPRVPTGGEMVRGLTGMLKMIPPANRTPPPERERRLRICEACESLKDGQCVECACIVRIKVAGADQECPLKKWVAVAVTVGGKPCGSCGGQVKPV